MWIVIVAFYGAVEYVVKPAKKEAKKLFVNDKKAFKSQLLNTNNFEHVSGVFYNVKSDFW